MSALRALLLASLEVANELFCDRSNLEYIFHGSGANSTTKKVIWNSFESGLAAHGVKDKGEAPHDVCAITTSVILILVFIFLMLGLSGAVAYIPVFH